MAEPGGGPTKSPRPHKDRDSGRDDSFGALVAQADQANDPRESRAGEAAKGRDQRADASAGNRETSRAGESQQTGNAETGKAQAGDAHKQKAGKQQTESGDSSASDTAETKAKSGTGEAGTAAAAAQGRGSHSPRTNGPGMPAGSAQQAADGRPAGEIPAQQAAAADAASKAATGTGDADRQRAAAGRGAHAHRHAGEDAPRHQGHRRGDAAATKADRTADAPKAANGADRGSGEQASARFSGQRVSVSVTSTTSDGQSPQRLSGETAIAAQIAGNGEDGRGERDRRAANGERGRARSADARAAAAMARSADAAAQENVARAAASREAAAAMRAARDAARTAPPNGAGANSASADGSGDGGSASGREGGLLTARNVSASSQTFDPLMQGSHQATGSSGQGADALARSSEAPAPNNARPTPAPPIREQVAVQIQRAAGQGQQHLNIRLQPPELGRIDVKLDVGDDGVTRATLSIDRPETLDLLQRDARGLERALQNAGLKTDGNSLNFDLRGEGGQEEDGSDTDGGAGHASGEADETSVAAPEDAADVPTPLRLSEDGLDIRV